METIFAYTVGFFGSANSSILWKILREPRQLLWQPNLGINQPKLHCFQLCARNRENFSVNSRVSEVCYIFRIFKGTKGVAMTTKFRQKYAKIAHILVLYKIWRHACTIGFSRLANSNMLGLSVFMEQAWCCYVDPI